MVTPAADPVLTRYLALDEDLVALSAETGQSIPALLDWLHTPEIVRTVARFRAHQAHQLTTLALSALAAIISSTPDLIEQRRAATTILKTLTGPATLRRRTRPADPGPFDDIDEGLDDQADDLNDDAQDDSDDSHDTIVLDHSADAEDRSHINLENAPAAAEINVEHLTSAASPVPPTHHRPEHAQAGCNPSAVAANPHHASSTRSATARLPQLGTPQSALGTSHAGAEQMKAYDNRYAHYSLPPCTGPPR